MFDEKQTVTIEFVAPFTAMMIGPTGCGKTHFTFRLLEALPSVCTEKPERVIYCYGAWQKRFLEYTSKMKFVNGIINVDEIPDDGKHTVLVIDDLMTELSKSKEAVDLFTKYSHHKNISCLFLVQKMFVPTAEMRTISTNTHHMFVFRNPRDKSSITHLANQVFPGYVNIVREAYSSATEHPFTHLMINMHQSTPKNARLIGNYLSLNPEIPMTAYVIPV